MAVRAGEVLEDVELPANGYDAKAYMREYRRKNAAKIRAQKRALYWKDAEASRAANKRNYEKHADARIAKAREYFLKNEAAGLARIKLWRRDNPKAVAASNRKWRSANPEKAAAHKLTRRSREVGGKITAEEIKAIITRQKGKCAICGRRGKLHMDHIMPLALGGGGEASNFQGLCPSCNSRKGAKHPVDFYRSIGLLL